MKVIHNTLSVIGSSTTSTVQNEQKHDANVEETFLVKCLKPTIHLETFDILRLAAFNGIALKMDFERTPFTSVNTRKHKERIFNNSCGYKSRLEMTP